MDSETYALNVGLTRYLKAQGLLVEKEVHLPDHCNQLTVHKPDTDNYGSEDIKALARSVYRMTGELPRSDIQGYLSGFASRHGVKPFYPPKPQWPLRNKVRTKRKG